MARHLRAARKYAQALFDTSSQDIMEHRLRCLEILKQMLESHADLSKAMLSPLVSDSDRQSVLQEIASLFLQDDQVLRDFLSLLVSNGRMGLLPEIAIQFGSLVSSFRKSLAVEVTTASEVPADERSHFEQTIREQVGSLSSFSWRSDPRLIGGIRVKVGDRLLDRSIAGTLERLRTQLH